MNHMEPLIVDSQYAYQRHRSAEVLLADLDGFALESHSDVRQFVWRVWILRAPLIVQIPCS